MTEVYKIIINRPN